MAGYLVRGGRVVDGTGAPAREADVRTLNGDIVEVGAGLRPSGETEIDASGAFVIPGLIDNHTHFDATTYWDPVCDPMPQHGVTSVLIGNCGLGLAPVRAADRARVSDLFSYIEDIPTTAFNEFVPWDWESFEDYAASLSATPLGVNVISLVSHTLLRIYAMGPAAAERAATEDELDRIAELLDRALGAGAIGLSSSLFDKDRLGNRVPSCFADEAELQRLFRVLGKHGAIFQVIAESQASAIEDLARYGRLAAAHGVTVLHNAIMHFSFAPQYSGRVVEQLRKSRAAGADVISMLSPRSFDLEINFDASLCFLDLPVWNGLVQADRPTKAAMLADPQWRGRARAEFDQVGRKAQMFPIGYPETLRIVRVGHAQFDEWMGRSFKDLIEARGGHPSDVLGDWLLDNDFDVRFINSVANTDQDAVGRLLKEPEVIVGGSDAGAHVQMFCACGDTTLFLTRHVRDRGDFTLEEGVRQLTGRQADLLRMPSRGRIAPGKAADLVVFNLDDLRWEPERLVADLPGGESRFTRPPGGYRCTMIGGAVVQSDGKATGTLSGRYLPRGA